jgi:hypothetical protein
MKDFRNLPFVPTVPSGGDVYDLVNDGSRRAQRSTSFKHGGADEGIEPQGGSYEAAPFRQVLDDAPESVLVILGAAQRSSERQEQRRSFR